MKFQKVQLQLNNRTIKIDYGWLLVIETIEQLIEYHKQILEAKLPNVWENLMEVTSGRQHIKTNIGMMINYAAFKNENLNKNLIELTEIVVSKILKAKYFALLEYGKIYVNKNGGFFPHIPEITVLDEVEIDRRRVVFPNYIMRQILEY